VGPELHATVVIDIDATRRDPPCPGGPLLGRARRAPRLPLRVIDEAGLAASCSCSPPPRRVTFPSVAPFRVLGPGLAPATSRRVVSRDRPAQARRRAASGERAGAPRPGRAPDREHPYIRGPRLILIVASRRTVADSARHRGPRVASVPCRDAHRPTRARDRRGCEGPRELCDAGSSGQGARGPGLEPARPQARRSHTRRPYPRPLRRPCPEPVTRAGRKVDLLGLALLDEAETHRWLEIVSVVRERPSSRLLGRDRSSRIRNER